MKNYILNILMLSLLFTACSTSDLEKTSLTDVDSFEEFMLGDDTKPTDKDGKDKDGSDKDNKDKKNCFKMVYPLSVEMPDETVFFGEEELLWSEVKTWYEAHPDNKKKPQFIFPIELVFANFDGVKTIENKDNLNEVLKYCDKHSDKKDIKDGKSDCVNLIYPVKYKMPDNSIIIMQNDEDWGEIKEWYTSHPDYEAKPLLNYPIKVKYKDGEIYLVNNEAEMIELKKKC